VPFSFIFCLCVLLARHAGAGCRGKTKPAKPQPSGLPSLPCVYILSPSLLSPHRIPPSIAVNIPSPQPVALTVVLATLTGMAGRLGIMSSALFGAKIAFRSSGVSFVRSSGFGSVLTLTFCAASMALCLCALGIAYHIPTPITAKRGFVIKPASTFLRHGVAPLFVCSTNSACLVFSSSW